MFNITPRLQAVAKMFNRDLSFSSPVVSSPTIDRRGLLPAFNATTPTKPPRRGAPQQIAALLRSLADTDPIIWSIRRTLREFVSQARWAIVPDMDEIKEELTRWREFELSNVNPYNIIGEFETSIITDEWEQKIRQDLAESEPRPMYGQQAYRKQAYGQQIGGQVPVPGQAPMQMAGGEDRYRDMKRLRTITVFDTYERLITQEISSHCIEAQELLEHPNNDSELSWRSLLTRTIDDILIYDAGVIIKNKSRSGQLAELYDLPGQEIRRWINPDRSTPQPPYAAYEWWHQGKPVQDARWTNEELVYIMANPQHDGYGFSPIEAAQYIIASSLDADKFNIDFIREYNVPPTVFTLTNVDPAARAAFELKLNEKTAGPGKFKTLVAGGINKEDFDVTQLKSVVPAEMQLDKWSRYCISVKAMVYGLSPQDVGLVLDFHRTTAEKQAELSQVRGVRSVLHLLAAYINAEIIKSEFAEDIMLKWLDVEGPVDEKEQAEISWGDMGRGVININDRRRDEGKPPIEGGDVNIIDTGMGRVPVKKLAQWDREQYQLTEPVVPGALAEAGAEEVPLEYADMMVGLSAEEQGTIYPEIGNPFAAQEEQQMAAAVIAGDISKAKDYWEKRRREIEKAISDGDLDTAQKKVEILRYNLQKVAAATQAQTVAGTETKADEVPPAADGAAFLRGVGAYVADIQRRMAEIVEEVAEE